MSQIIDKHFNRKVGRGRRFITGHEQKVHLHSRMRQQRWSATVRKINTTTAANGKLIKPIVYEQFPFFTFRSYRKLCKCAIIRAKQVLHSSKRTLFCHSTTTFKASERALSKRPIYLDFCKVLNWKKLLLPLLVPHSAHFRLILFLSLSRTVFLIATLSSSSLVHVCFTESNSNSSLFRFYFTLSRSLFFYFPQRFFFLFFCRTFWYFYFGWIERENLFKFPRNSLWIERACVASWLIVLHLFYWMHMLPLLAFHIHSLNKFSSSSPIRCSNFFFIIVEQVKKKILRDFS